MHSLQVADEGAVLLGAWLLRSRMGRLIQLALPRKRVPDDRFEVIVPRPPAQERMDTAIRRDKLVRVPFAPGCQYSRHRAAGAWDTPAR